MQFPYCKPRRRQPQQLQLLALLKLHMTTSSYHNNSCQVQEIFTLPPSFRRTRWGQKDTIRSHSHRSQHNLHPHQGRNHLVGMGRDCCSEAERYKKRYINLTAIRKPPPSSFREHSASREDCWQVFRRGDSVTGFLVFGVIRPNMKAEFLLKFLTLSCPQASDWDSEG